MRQANGISSITTESVCVQTCQTTSSANGGQFIPPLDLSTYCYTEQLLIVFLGAELIGSTCYCGGSNLQGGALATSPPAGTTRKTTAGAMLALVGNCTNYPGMSAYNCATVTYPLGGCMTTDGSGACK